MLCKTITWSYRICLLFMLQVVSPGSTRVSPVNIETRCVCCGFGGLGVGGEDGFRGRRDIIAASEPIRLDIPESDVGAARGTSLYLTQYPAVVGGRGSPSGHLPTAGTVSHTCHPILLHLNGALCISLRLQDLLRLVCAVYNGGRCRRWMRFAGIVQRYLHPGCFSRLYRTVSCDFDVTSILTNPLYFSVSLFHSYRIFSIEKADSRVLERRHHKWEARRFDTRVAQQPSSSWPIWQEWVLDSIEDWER